MAKPFGNMAQLTGDILDSYIMGLQAGSTPDDAGLDEMKYVRVDKLRRYIREGLVTAYTPRENSSTDTPSSPQVGDIFMCTGEFTESGVTYQLNHFYVYTTQLAWEDITAGIKGPKGDTGATPLLSVGEVTYGDTPDVTIDTTDPAHPVMNFVLKTSEVGVVDNLTSDSSVDALSAKQGRLLKQETTDLQSQIVNTNAELDNVEALIGGDAQVENTDPAEGESLLAQSRLIHHANLLPNGSFGRLGARSVAWNQLLNKNNFPASTTYNNGNLVYTNNGDGSITLRTTATTTADVTIALESVTSAKGAVSGHTYVFKGGASGVKFGTGNGAGINEEGTGRVAVVTFSSSISMGYLIPSGTTIATAVTLYPLLCDLTTMNMASLTADQFRALFPASYYPTDTGHIYDLNPSGFRIRGINLWDEVSERGYYDASGVFTASNFQICSENLIPVIPNKTYYFAMPSIGQAASGRFCYYDANGTFMYRSDLVAYLANNPFTVPSGCFFIKWHIDYANAYSGGIQICYNSLPTALKTAYHAYDGHIVYTPQIADGHYVNEDCFDYVENVTEDGIVKGKKHTVVGSVDLGTLNYSPYSTYLGTFYAVMPSDSASPISGYGIGSLCGKYVRENASGYMSGDKCYICNSLGMTTQKVIYFKDTAYTDAATFKASLSGVMLYYELATESVTDVDPIRSFPVTDYCTIEPITPQTELVNRIDVPFSVKSVSANTLIEQINQNTADIAEEKAIRSAQVSALNKRVTNLELKTGDQFDVDYPSGTYGMDEVPASVAEYAKVVKLEGVSRVANNGIKNGDFSQGTSDWTTLFSTLNVVNGVAEITKATANPSLIQPSTDVSLLAGHSYLGIADLKGEYSFVSLYDPSLFSSVAYSLQTPTDSSFMNCSFVYTVPSGGVSAKFGLRNSTGGGADKTFYAKNVGFVDLNIYFNTTDLSFLGATDSAKLATIQKDYPHLLLPSDYGTRVIDWTGNGVRAEGVNIWDEEVLMGAISVTDGAFVPSQTGNICSDFIPIVPNASYYLLCIALSSKNGRTRFYDISKNYIGYTDNSGNVVYWNTSFVSPQNAFYMRFEVQSKYGTTYNHDIQICLNSYPDKTTYHPYIESTLSFPSTSLKSAGSVREKKLLNVEVEIDGQKVQKSVKTNPLGSYTFTADDAWEVYYAPNGLYSIPFPLMKVGSVNAILLGYTFYDSYSAWGDASDKALYKSSDGRLYVKNVACTSLALIKAEMAGKTLRYELVTPDPDTYSDPILDPFIKVEGGGTIRPIQTQTPEVDSAMSIEYMAS